MKCHHQSHCKHHSKNQSLKMSSLLRLKKPRLSVLKLRSNTWTQMAFMSVTNVLCIPEALEPTATWIFACHLKDWCQTEDVRNAQMAKSKGSTVRLVKHQKLRMKLNLISTWFHTLSTMETSAHQESSWTTMASAMLAPKEQLCQPMEDHASGNHQPKTHLATWA